MKVKKLYADAKIPTKGSDYAAGYDLYAMFNYDIKSRETEKVSVGITVEIPEGYFGAIFPRSGLATKQGLRLANCVGVIDSDYRGEWFVPLYNDSDRIRKIQQGDRIAQVVFIPYLNTTFEEVDCLSDSNRGNGGFGSTGSK